MLRITAILAFVAAATAASWPMVTVNSAGDIVLNSVTRAQSFQLTPSTVTAAPTSGSATLTTVTALSADVDTFKVNIPSTIGTSGGYKLPAASVGRSITLFNDGTGAGAFTVWTDSTTTFFNSGATTTYAVAASTTSVTFTATDSTNWVVSSTAASKKGSVSVDTTSTNTAAATLTAAQLMNGFYQFAGTSTAAITTPTGASIEAALATPGVNDSFEFTLYASSTAGATLTAAASGVTITAAEAYVAAGTRKTFIVYRTAANAYTFLLKSAAPAFSGSGLGHFTSVSADATLNEAQDGQVIAVSTASTVTLPSCTSSNLGLSYKVVVTGAVDVTIQTGTTDLIAGFTTKGADSGAGDAVKTTATTGSVSLVSAAIPGSGTDGGAYAEFICALATAWFSPNMVGNAAPTAT